MELLRQSYLSKLVRAYKNAPGELDKVFSWWVETPQILRYEAESSLYESLLNIDLKKADQQRYTWIIYPAAYSEFKTKEMAGFWSCYDPETNDLILIIDLNNELLKASFQLTPGKKASALIKTGSFKRYRLKTKTNGKSDKLEKLISLPVKNSNRLIETCLKVLTDICDSPPEKPVRPTYIYKDFPERQNSTQPNELKNYDKPYRRAAGWITKPDKYRYRYSEVGPG